MEQAAKRKMIFIILVLCIAVSPITAFANTNNSLHTLRGAQSNTENNWFSRDELPLRQLGLNIHGSVPMVMPSFGDNYQLINERIDNIVADLINEARRSRARSITFVYEIYPTSNMVSILLRAEISSVISRTLVRSVNFCPNTGRFLTIRDSMRYNIGPHADITPLVNIMLMTRMRRSPENYYAAPSIALENQPFIVTDHSITILFDEFQLSSMVSGVYELELLKDSIQSVNIFEFQLLPTRHTYGLIMVPLHIAFESLSGYRARWENGRVEIQNIRDEDNPHLVAWMQVGINQYHTSPDVVRSLEAAPYLRDGRTYVPITFFEQILPLSVYNIDSFGNIIILAYLP
ncbi:MAG: copper amine oxidase N-terminal domain-containing protein [Firmicutes bacterium]|nr:copper amine oxidase N-terminal domain-containing protein [Bacillota bacterium]